MCTDVAVFVQTSKKIPLFVFIEDELKFVIVKGVLRDCVFVVLVHCGWRWENRVDCDSRL